MRKLVFIALIFITSVCIVTNVFGRGDKKETYTYYEEVNILNGESYWNIAQKYQSDGMDKKEYANYIKNKFSNSIYNNSKISQIIYK